MRRGCANATYTAVFLQFLLPLHFACMGKQPGQPLCLIERTHIYCIKNQEMMMFPVKRNSETGYRLMVNSKASSHIQLLICTCSLYQMYKNNDGTVYNLQTLVSRRLVLPDE